MADPFARGVRVEATAATPRPTHARAGSSQQHTRSSISIPTVVVEPAPSLISIENLFPGARIISLQENSQSNAGSSGSCAPMSAAGATLATQSSTAGGGGGGGGEGAAPEATTSAPCSPPSPLPPQPHSITLTLAGVAGRRTVVVRHSAAVTASTGMAAAAAEGQTVLVLGPTGSGKTALLNQLTSKNERAGSEDEAGNLLPPATKLNWDPSKAIISQFNSTDAKKVEGSTSVAAAAVAATGTNDCAAESSSGASTSAPGQAAHASARAWLTRVGLNSVPSWVKPYHILSTGERFRATLARKAQQAAQTETILASIMYILRRICYFF